jgi:hypothetical protein
MEPFELLRSMQLLKVQLLNMKQLHNMCVWMFVCIRVWEGVGLEVPNHP